jgi:hypothetical protein
LPELWQMNSKFHNVPPVGFSLAGQCTANRWCEESCKVLRKTKIL